MNADVVIVGAGPVGLSLALELGLRGRSVILLERASSRGPQPRAKTLNMRSLEHFRRWGIADAVRAASPIPSDLPRDVVFQTRLFGHPIATLENIYFRGGSCDADPRFCEPSEWIPQHVVEDVMRARLAELGNVSILYGHAFVAFDDDGDGVTVEARGPDDGHLRIRAAWLVGADGARSDVRAQCGIEMRGRHAFAANYNMVLHIPELDRSPPHPRGLMHWIINADSPAVMGPIGPNWYLAKQLPPGVPALDDAEIRACVAGAVGRDVDFEILSRDPWYAHELIADRYRQGRVFLAGDACHLHPPFGGYGMNMGIADAVDLGWKLDAMLAGWGGDALLDSYEVERRRVHLWTIDEAIENYRLLSADLLQPGLEDDGPAGAALRDALAEQIVDQKRREFHTIGLVLGYHYGGSPVIAGDDDLPPPSTEEYEPMAKCGALAPHVWLAEGVSLYDRFSTGFTLIDTGADDDAALPILHAASALGIPVQHLPLESDAVAGLYGCGLVLVRPDQHIAWHGGALERASAVAMLETVSGRPHAATR